MASEPNPSAPAISAMEWIAKHGWPEESRGRMTVTSEGGVTTVTHIHQS
jgi:hypothetical protein